ncbi:hypothetical protein SAMN06269250_6334 [Spirosoma fluviale]|uniref:Uncharacterized protein n=1 Tax=Spirosoma fluviale TaxID=1597977 RepID=A0A286GUQ0_9BACT|nr:hypothetical protein SAMN06269250_6334 [Spirosoma fluviale]
MFDKGRGAQTSTYNKVYFNSTMLNTKVKVDFTMSSFFYYFYF